MCLFSVAYRIVPDCPVLIFANREESPDRPSVVPRVMENPLPKTAWIGGQDLEAGGTWLGVSQSGLVVAVTNRPKTHKPETPKSRGVLCRDLLECGSLPAAEAEFRRQWERESFAGFNLMLISPERGVVISAGDGLRIQEMDAGLHAVTNGDWNDPDDRRIQRVRGLMEAFHGDEPAWEEWIPWAKRICGLGEQAGGDALCYPCTGGWGTVSSSVIALPSDLHLARYEHAAGSPATTPYEDYSPRLVSLLKRAT